MTLYSGSTQRLTLIMHGHAQSVCRSIRAGKISRRAAYCKAILTAVGKLQSGTYRTIENVIVRPLLHLDVAKALDVTDRENFGQTGRKRQLRLPVSISTLLPLGESENLPSRHYNNAIDGNGLPSESRREHMAD